MFQRVLIAEDYECYSIAIRVTLDTLGIYPLQSNDHYRYHCDDALLAIQKALRNNQPYELLITDLSFVDDGRRQQITCGEELITAAREIQPDLKVLVFSIENKPHKIDSLFVEQGINGYVPKGRRDAQELKTAIETIYKGNRYRPAAPVSFSKNDPHYKPTDWDIKLITLLSEGVPQKDIPLRLKELQVTPSGLSTIEKRLSFLKEILGCSQNTQLVVYCRDMGII